ncbi:hypothetical protein M885DRAFT_504474 [Pelagophyceae sp. CCMP2097]|nr:hypothetical protein M885DRAFT_504474 [Pelagophyceae sp. CCMP2097]
MPIMRFLFVAGAAALTTGPARRAGSTVRMSAAPPGDAPAVAAPAVAPADARPHAVVVGGGWAGLGAAKALRESGCRVTLLDAGDPSAAMTTETGKPFEPGMRGFWKDYPNINALGDELNIVGAYSPFTESSFFGPQGLECTAPVFGDGPALPSPLGQVFASFDRFKRLPVLDRLSIVGLLAAMLDLNRSPEVFAAYDRMSAHELFKTLGVSKRLVDDFLKPTLLVGLFKPPEELSAAVVMELLYYYALAHQTSFDVRWLARGTVQTTLLKPLVDKLAEDGVEVKPRCFVEELVYDGSNDAVKTVRFRDGASGESMAIDDVDAVVLALGATGMKKVMGKSNDLAARCPELAAAASLNAIDVVSVRIWFDEVVQTDTPVGVFSRFEELRGAGGTFFMLDQLQKDDLDALWGGDNSTKRGSVLSCDFYNGGAVATLSDDEIVRLLSKVLLPKAYSAFRSANVVDSCVKRFPSAVSWFSPGSFGKRPPLQTSVANVACAGDWVRMGDREHGAKGLCQERALVSGYEAANSLAAGGALGAAMRRKERTVLPIRDDEPAYLAGVRANGLVQGALDRVGLGSFWVR